MISIIVPIYNVEKYLPKCLDSLLNQTFKGNYELILVNDGSTDNSGKIVDDYKKKYPDKIKVIHKKNEGLSITRNTGIDQAKGDYLLFVDSDDWIEKETLEILNKHVENNPDVDMIVFDYITEDTYGNILSKKNSSYRNEIIKIDEKNIENTFFEMKGYAWNKLYKKELFKDKEIRFSEGLYYEDIGSYPKFFFESSKIQVITDSPYHYVLGREGSIVSIKSYDRIIDMYKNVVLFKEYLLNKGKYVQYEEIFKKYQFNIIYTLIESIFLLPKMKDRNRLIKFIYRWKKEESININEIENHQINDVKIIKTKKKYIKLLIKMLYFPYFFSSFYVNFMMYLLSIRRKIK
ncbi:MAG: glycosyltransferase family 2 protein [Flavobacteriales bacterium]